MPKRKRSIEQTVQNKLEQYRISLFRAISSSKAFERKRFRSRLRDHEIIAEKKARLESEHAVLKGLDLRRTARSHLHSNLLKIKAIETSNHIPEELRADVPRPNLSHDELTLQNNVISMLCNTGPARQALDRAITDICETLGVPVPEKSKRQRKNMRKDTEEQPLNKILSPAVEEAENAEHSVERAPKPKVLAQVSDGLSEEETEFEGFESDVDEPGPAIGKLNDEGFEEEAAISKYADLLGGSSDEEEVEFDDDLLAKYRGKEQANLDDISLSGSAPDIDSDEEPRSDLGSPSPSPPPPKKARKGDKNGDNEKLKDPKTKNDNKLSKEEAKKKRDARAAVKAARPGDSTFLPSLMGGYISGSESASDVDTPPKKRRGQRARQAIWEQKYGARAKHLQKQAAKGGRDDGWDMRRGAVGPEDQGRGNPWKKGGRLPPGRDTRGPQGRGSFHENRPRPEPKQTKKDDEGPLHPSWEARKKAMDSQKGAAFAGKMIVFD